MTDRPPPSILVLTGGGSLAVLLTAGAVALSLRTQSPTPDPSLAPPLSLAPPPTEHWLGPDAELNNKHARKQWMNEWAHRAPPGVDWEQIERENGLAQIEKRNALAGAPWPPELPEGQWQERGSDNLAGRMHVATHSPDGQTLYAGSAKGGVWQGELGGEGWQELGDNLYGGAHWLVVSDLDGQDLMLAATDGGLMHYSADGGETWTAPQGLGTLGNVRRLIQSSSGGVFAVVLEWEWEDEWKTHSRLYRSQDGGRSFERVRSLSEGADLFCARDGSSPDLYLADSDVLWLSRDDGESWTPQGELPVSGRGSRLAGSEAGAPRLWLAAEDPDLLFVSDDLGSSWTGVGEMSDFWGTFAASIVDVELLAWGGVHVHYTENGQDFQVVNQWSDYYSDPKSKLHADIPGLDVALDGEGGEIWYISTDGGLYRSLDSLQSVENLSLKGLRVSQYYDVLTSSADPTHVHAGAQDQGYQATQGFVQDDDILGFDQLLSGDYGHLTSGDGTHHLVFSVYPGFLLVAQGEDTVELGYVDFPPQAKSYAWLPPLVADPLDAEAVLFCADKLYRYDYDQEAGTYVASTHSSFDFQDNAGEYLSSVAFAPSDPRVAVAVTSYGRIFTSGDGGLAWERSDAQGPYGHYFYGHSLIISAMDPQVVYMGGAGYGGDTLYRSTDGGLSWHGWSQGMPSTTAYGLVEARDGSGRVFAATENAAYVREPDGESWEDLSAASAPVTTYWSVEILAHENTARFGTYGRGIWDFVMPTPQECYPVVDQDRDGVDCRSDCDDSDAELGVPTEEICGDGIDQDCDGQDALCPEPPESGAPDIEPKGCSGCGGELGGGSGGVFLGLLVLLAMRRHSRTHIGYTAATPTTPEC